MSITVQPEQKLNELQVNLHLNHTLYSSLYLYTYLPIPPVFPGVSKFFIRSPGLPVRAPNLPGNTFRGLFRNFFINFVIFEMSKRKMKQEVNLVLLFELFLIRKCKTEQSNWCIFNKYCNWSEINQSNCTILGRKLAWFSLAVIDVGNIRKAFGWFSESIQTVLKISRHLQILYSGGWQVCI